MINNKDKKAVTEILVGVAFSDLAEGLVWLVLDNPVAIWTSLAFLALTALTHRQARSLAPL